MKIKERILIPVEESLKEEILKDVSAIVVPGGFGVRGTYGKIKAIKYAREHKIPFLGLCLGMQLCVVSFLITGQRTIFDKQRFHFDKNLSDDDDDTEEQTRPQLENTLRKRNFFLSMVRHLIPQDTPNTTAKKDNETSSAANIKPEQETKAQQSKPKNKFEAKQTLTETLFGHLFPKDEIEELQNKKSENKTKNK